MRGFKLFGAGAVAFALAVTVLPASAGAAAKVLVLTDSGTPVPTGAKANIGLAIAECVVYSEGTVTVNGATKDKINATKPALTECEEEGVTESGIITEAQLGSNGKATFKGTITISKPGPCVYAYKKFKGIFSIPGKVFFEETTVGKLSKKVSSKACATTDTQVFFADATNSGFKMLTSELK